MVGPRGLLLIERVDRTPPIAFPGGKVDAGETVLQAVEREVLEETSLRVKGSAVLATRVHPKTGASVAYVAADPLTAADPVPAVKEALSASWWLLPEALFQLAEELESDVLTYLRGRL